MAEMSRVLDETEVHPHPDAGEEGAASLPLLMVWAVQKNARRPG